MMHAMFVVKVVTVLLAAAALLNTVCEMHQGVRPGTNVMKLSRGFMHRMAKWTHHGHHHEHPMHTMMHNTMGKLAEVVQLDEGEEHRREWGFEDKGDKVAWFHQAMRQKMKAVHECHHNCGPDAECHKKCPKPWARFQEKCDEMEPIMACHHQCRHSGQGHKCHEQCPLPKCPMLASKVQKTMECHKKCEPHDHSCHHQCPKPFQHLRTKCGMLREIHTCHEKCSPGDCACHHQCPKFSALWQHPQVSIEPVDAAEHHREWGFEGKMGHPHDHKAFHHFMSGKMAKVHECHHSCGADAACHEKCPKPWAHFAEKCREMDPIMACHHKCHHAADRHACHGQCPLPKCPMLAGKMQEAHECHGKCQAGDFACHHQCPKPLKRLREKCGELDGIMACHKQCAPGDFACHHQCPKFHKIWHHSHGEIHEADGEQHRREWGFEEHHEEGRKKFFEQAMRFKMHQVAVCHEKCGADGPCHSKCPRPWEHLEMKCNKMQPIMACHMKCTTAEDETTCHSQCPKPQCPRFAAKVNFAWLCHKNCGSDMQCHQHCPKPMQKLVEKCGKLQTILSCHRGCPFGDMGCHRKCPKFVQLWEHSHAVAV